MFASCKLREIKFFFIYKKIRTYPLYLSDTFKKWIFSDTNFKIQIKKVKKKKTFSLIKTTSGITRKGESWTCIAMLIVYACLFNFSVLYMPCWNFEMT